MKSIAKTKLTEREGKGERERTSGFVEEEEGIGGERIERAAGEGVLGGLLVEVLDGFGAYLPPCLLPFPSALRL